MSEQDLSLITFRQGLTETDRPFLFSSWLHSYFDSDATQGVNPRMYYEGQHRLIESVLAAGAEVRLAVSKDDPDTIIGWLCLSEGWVHYAYVKQTFRRSGIAKALLGDPGPIEGFTQRTQICKRLQIPSHWKYDPYRIWAP